jgi:hypothetical protein
MSRCQGEAPVCSPLSSNRKANLRNRSRNPMRVMGAPTSLASRCVGATRTAPLAAPARKSMKVPADQQTVIAKPAVRPSEVPNREFFLAEQGIFWSEHREFQGRSRTHRQQSTSAPSCPRFAAQPCATPPRHFANLTPAGVPILPPSRFANPSPAISPAGRRPFCKSVARHPPGIGSFVSAMLPWADRIAAGAQ